MYVLCIYMYILLSRYKCVYIYQVLYTYIKYQVVVILQDRESTAIQHL